MLQQTVRSIYMIISTNGDTNIYVVIVQSNLYSSKRHCNCKNTLQEIHYLYICHGVFHFLNVMVGCFYAPQTVNFYVDTCMLCSAKKNNLFFVLLDK